LNLGRREHALLTELMLRGYQTVGELRNRASRMYDFSDLDEVEACLRSMMERDGGPLVTQLPHLPGTKEVRWAHMLSGPPAPETLAEPGRATAQHTTGPSERISALEAEIGALRAEIEALKTQFQEFRRQFE
jgi:uncharacterized protein YceH (UPF0502 family)